MKLEKILRMDRRIIFVLMAILVFTPIFFKINFPGIEATDVVKGVYNEIESLPPGSAVLISMDFDPASKPELQPISTAIIRHCFSKDIKVVGMTLVVTGTDLAYKVMSEIGKEYKKIEHRDWVFLGWNVGGLIVIQTMGQSIAQIFPKDYKKVELEKIEVMRKIKKLNDFGYVISITAGAAVETWIIYGSDRFKFKLGGACTAVVEPGLRQFIQSKQITGLIGGMRGAAEYEQLLKKPDKGTAGMDAISLGQYLIVLLILSVNIIYFLMKEKK